MLVVVINLMSTGGEKAHGKALKLESIQEAINPKTGKVLSLLMVGKSEATT